VAFLLNVQEISPRQGRVEMTALVEMFPDNEPAPIYSRVRTPGGKNKND
jgi:hypothetical protein